MLAVLLILAAPLPPQAPRLRQAPLPPQAPPLRVPVRPVVVQPPAILHHAPPVYWPAPTVRYVHPQPLPWHAAPAYLPFRGGAACPPSGG